MANTNRPFGFKPVQNLSGAPWNGKARRYIQDNAVTTDLFLGDLVVQHATADHGYHGITRATDTTASVILGTVVGFDFVQLGGGDSLAGGGANDINLGKLYHEGSDAVDRIVWVVDDPNIICEAQFDSGGDQPDQVDVGNNYDIVTTAGDTATGVSNMEIDASSEVTTAATPLRLVGLVLRPDNSIVDAAAEQKGLVWFNMHVYRTATGAAGV